ncbi:MAG TPA: neutral zinc metallopeptidase [Candidatus Polarisedimenticolia bacterium]|nr:neutral zinc metallopeptidase [Candidatus Polarisedimenticolia bacterium]
MRWMGRRESGNIEDRRGMTAGRLGIGGGIGGLVVLLLYLFLGGDPEQLQQSLPNGPGGDEQQAGAPYRESAEEGNLRHFVGVVLADTEDTWHAIFRDMGREYREPKLTLFSGAVDSACGFAEAAVGPFYCPPDERVYIDLSFYQELQDRFGAPGDFAQAYVIAHEIGHHVQNLLGISEKVQAAQQRSDERQASALSVRLELQADCLAGVWAHHASAARDLLEQGDIEEGLGAASAIGDDRLQRQSRGYVTPESFTHGSSAQRVRWFRQGIDAGTVDACDTFNAGRL